MVLQIISGFGLIFPSTNQTPNGRLRRFKIMIVCSHALTRKLGHLNVGMAVTRWLNEIRSWLYIRERINIRISSIVASLYNVLNQSMYNRMQVIWPIQKLNWQYLHEFNYLLVLHEKTKLCVAGLNRIYFVWHSSPFEYPIHQYRFIIIPTSNEI